MRRRRTPQGEPGMLSRQPPASRPTPPPFLYRGTRLFRRHTSHEFEKSNTSPTQDLYLSPTHSLAHQGRRALRVEPHCGQILRLLWRLRCHARTHARSSHSAPPHCTARTVSAIAMWCHILHFWAPKETHVNEPTSQHFHSRSTMHSVTLPCSRTPNKNGTPKKVLKKGTPQKGTPRTTPGTKVRAHSDAVGACPVCPTTLPCRAQLSLLVMRVQQPMPRSEVAVRVGVGGALSAAC